ncbi:MAG: FGGY-family carbohydrate kinase [Candidatus Bathyarchaeia archaeon]
MYLMGTDIGTQGTKTVLIDLDGVIHAEATMEYEVRHPKQSWAEQWPSVWRDAALTTIRRVTERRGVEPKEIKGLCISSLYGGSGIPLDGKMRAIRPCIIWADRRSTDECRWVEERIGTKEIFDVTGNIIDPYYGYTKMLWIKRNEPDTWQDITRIETPNSYVIRALTGEESIDYSSAGNYGGIFDIRRRDWSEERMDELGIPRTFFPEEIRESRDVVGEVNEEGERRSGLAKGTPVCAGGIDAAVSALAAGATEDGDLASMLGSSMCNGFISHKLRLSPRLVNFPYVLEGRKHIYSFTGISTAGYGVRWFRDQLGAEEMRVAEATGEDAYAILDELAEGVPPGSEDLIFLPHLMVGERAPYWDKHLRGGYLGLTISHTRGHLFRAILEGVAYTMRYSIEAARETGIAIRQATLVDGGARSPLWRQIIADVTELDMTYIPDFPGTPMGDAFLAGLGAGVVEDQSVIDEWVNRKIRIEPDPEGVEAYKKLYRLYVKSLETLRCLFREF